MATEWKASRLFPDYDVSNDGRVRRNVQGGRRYPAGYELASKPHKRGYRYFILRRDGKDFTVLAHRLVAMEWLGEPPSVVHEVAHNDGSRVNNRVDNLRWATSAENQADRKRHGTYTIGEQAPAAKLTDSDVDEIRQAYSDGGRRYVGGSVTMETIAKQFGVSVAQVSRVVNGRQRSHTV